MKISRIQVKNFRSFGDLDLQLGDLNEVDNFIRAIESAKNEYIFLADIDLSSCVTDKKEKLCQTYRTLTEQQI